VNTLPRAAEDDVLVRVVARAIAEIVTALRDSGYLDSPGQAEIVRLTPVIESPEMGGASSPLDREDAALHLWTVAEVSAMLRLSRSVVYSLLRTERLRSVLVGRSRRIPTAALVEFIDSL
jgi:excisionase family DNA binding protein